jgi:hypothetical protein
LLDLLAAGASGSDSSYRDYMVSYFSTSLIAKEDAEDLKESPNVPDGSPGTKSSGED